MSTSANYTYLNEISASDGFYAIDTTAPIVSVLYTVPSTKIHGEYVTVYANAHDVGGIASSGITIHGNITPVSGFTKTGNNYQFYFNVSATGSIEIEVYDIAGNMGSFISTGYIISAAPTDHIPPVISFFNSSPIDKRLTSASIGSVHVRVFDNYSIAANPLNFTLSDESVGMIDESSIVSINEKTVEFDIINIVESGYVILTAKDDAGNITTASDGFWVSTCSDGKKINITNFLPSHLRESEMFDFMKFFEDFLNSMYYNKSTGCNISILEKINKLKDFKDIDALDSDYFQFFADHFGYEVNVNRESIGLFSTSGSEKEIDDYIRLSLKNLPNFNRLKSSEDAISIMLFSFGVIADIVYLWTNDYDKNWKGESRYNNINVRAEIPDTNPPYYPTSHFKLAVNYSQTPPNWISNFDKIIAIIDTIKPINTVFKEFSGYFEPIVQDPYSPNSLGRTVSFHLIGRLEIPWVGHVASYQI